MKFPAIFFRTLRACALFGLSLPSLAAAQDANPPVVTDPIADVTVTASSPPTVINVKKTFGLSGVTGKLVRMTTNVGNIDLELFSDAAPNTAANFLNYVTSGSYDNVIIHRVATQKEEGLAIIQGGETTLVGNANSFITSFGNVNNEYSLPNTRGTIAMAKLSGQPDSATDQWFFNVSDNSDVLGSNNNGGFTVFGRVLGRGLETVDAIGALKGYDLSSVRADWNSIPLYNYDASQSVTPANLVVASSVAVLPTVSKGAGYPGALKVKVKGNTNPGLVTATMQARKVILTYAPGKTGTSVITLAASDTAKSKVTHTFNVTVQ